MSDGLVLAKPLVRFAGDVEGDRQSSIGCEGYRAPTENFQMLWGYFWGYLRNKGKPKFFL
jgi:hypothetical protein